MKGLLVVSMVVLVLLTGCQVDEVVVSVDAPILESGIYEGAFEVTLEDGSVYKGKGVFMVRVGDWEPQEGDQGDAGAVQLVNINTAGVDVLATLPGIGPVKASAIVRYRDEVDGFDSIEELESVAGIGAKTMDKLRDLVTVG